MSKDLFLNALCPSVHGDSSARRIPYLEKQLVREVLSISVSVLKKKENNMYLWAEIRTARRAFSIIHIPGLPVT